MIADLVDTHCHLGDYSDPSKVLQRAAESSVGLIAVSNNPEQFQRMRARLRGRPNATPALGLHPEHPTSYQQGQRERFLRLLATADWVGEVGLDYSTRWSSRERRLQRQNFELVMHTPLISGKPATIHSRGAIDDVLEILGSSPATPILHWYSGPIDKVDHAVQLGCYFSVNSAMTGAARFRRLMEAIPRSRVLLESDGPHVQVLRRAAEPTDIRDVKDAVSAVWQSTREATTERLAANFRALSGDSS